MATKVIVREDLALTVECEFCHLGASDAVAVLHYRLKERRNAQACRGCVARMSTEVTAQMDAARRAS